MAKAWIASLSLLIVAGCGGSGGPTPSASRTLSGTYDLVGLESGGQSTRCPGSIETDGSDLSCTATDTFTFRKNGTVRFSSGSGGVTSTYVLTNRTLTFMQGNGHKETADIEEREDGKVLRLTFHFDRYTLVQVMRRQADRV